MRGEEGGIRRLRGEPERGQLAVAGLETIYLDAFTLVFGVGANVGEIVAGGGAGGVPPEDQAGKKNAP